VQGRGPEEAAIPGRTHAARALNAPVSNTFHFSFAIAEAYSAAARTQKSRDSLFSSFHEQNVLTENN